MLGLAGLAQAQPGDWDPVFATVRRELERLKRQSKGPL